MILSCLLDYHKKNEHRWIDINSHIEKIFKNKINIEN